MAFSTLEIVGSILLVKESVLEGVRQGTVFVVHQHCLKGEGSAGSEQISLNPQMCLEGPG